MKSFISLQFILYICFIVLDMTGKAIAVSNQIKLISIVLCFAFAIFQFYLKHTRIAFLQVCILGFTLISDYFLLLTNAYSVGIVTFIMVQLGYSGALKLAKNQAKNQALTRTEYLISGALIVISMILLKFDVTVGLSLLYAVLFVRNLFVAHKARKLSQYNRWLFIGLLLYAICDIQVAMFNLEVIKTHFTWLYSVVAVGMWVFYLPGQVILTLSPRLIQSE